MRRKLAIIFVLMFVLIMAALTWLITTQSGLIWMASQAQKMVPALQIGQIEGRLSHSVHVQNLRYQPENATTVTVADFLLEWTPSALFRGMFYVDTLHATGINIKLVATAEDEPEEADLSLPELVLPVGVTLNDVAVSDVVLEQNNKTIPVVQTLKTRIEAKAANLHIDNLQVEREKTALQVNGDLGLTSPYPLTIQYQINSNEFTPKMLSLSGALNGDSEDLIINQRTTAPFESSIEAHLTDVIDDLNWTALIKADEIRLADLLSGQQTAITQLTLTSKGSLHAATLQASSTVLQPELPPVSITTTADSTDFINWLVNVQANISEQQFARMQATINTEDDLQAEAKLSWQQLQWPLTQQQPDYVSEKGELTFAGSMDAYQAQLHADVMVQNQQAELTVAATGSNTEIKVNTMQIVGFGGQMQANGHVDWQTQPLQYQLDADWQDIELPQALTTLPVILNHGKIQLLGSPETLVLDSDADITLDGKNASLGIHARGDYARGFDHADVDIHLAEGRLRYQGQAFWQGASLIDGHVQLTQLNPGVVAPQWPGQLSGQTDIKITQAETGLTASLATLDIQGSLRQRPLSLTGAASYNANLIQLKQLLLKTGQSRVLVDGQIKDSNLAINFDVDAVDLTDFHPDAQGRLQLKGSSHGSLSEPTVDATVTAANLVYQNYAVAGVEGQIKAGLATNSTLATQLTIDAIQTPQLVVDTLTLSVTGKQSAHQLQLAMQSEALDLSVEANGRWQNNTWRGNLNQFDFSNEQAGDWQLRQHDEIVVSAASQSLPEHCWAAINGELCLQAQQQANQWQTAGSFKQVPLSLFDGFITQLQQLKGELRGAFSITAQADKAITGQGEVYLDNASLKLDQDVINQKQAIALNNTALRFNTDASQTQASFHLEPELEGVSAIDASLQTAGLSTLLADPQQAPLQGRINTAISDLSLLQLSHPAIDDLKGALNVDIGLDGSIGQPEIVGQARFRGGEVRIVDAGILLKDVSVNVDGNLDTVNFDYHASSGDGSLNGSGQFVLTDASWRLTTALKASQFQVMNTPEMLVIAEPDMAIEVTPSLTRVTGKVHIPYAELEPKQFNSSVSPSSDVVVIRHDAEDQVGGPRTVVDITVSLGDKVKLKAMGFQGRLTGQLRVSGDTSDILLGNGEIQIKEGSYLAYGQLLKVDNGRIRFAGNIENPELDIKAVREGEDYKAGLHIEGHVSSPVASLFSDPAMDQDNILSYILLGKPIEQASATDAAILASAATGMGLQNGAMIGDQIANTFGLDEFSVGGDSAENAAVHVGKYLSPKLYLSYGIGVFEPVSTVELRYQLSKIWALRAESGTESGVDLLYTYEKK